MRKEGPKPSKPNVHFIKAIIPAAGIGSRFQPFTLAVPKELLTVKRKPLIQLAVEEALAAGIHEIGIVIREGKEAIRSHFEALTTSSNPLWETLRKELCRAELRFIFQKETLGLGNAIYESGSFISDSPFVMIIPDQFILSGVPATRQLLDAASEDPQAVWSSLVTVYAEELNLFPGARKFKLSNRISNTWEVTRIQEQSEAERGEILLGFGRTFFPAGVIDFFSEKFLNPVTEEVDLLLTFGALIKKYKNYAVLLDGKAMDFGTWKGYEYFIKYLGLSKAE
ncbi:MAG: 2-C-methyl-D-erythritol 4-phosphate cytidylyltransferase [Deltaproteobacteria bacterium]|nr:2-C-methyl-D-erythritol 4-phosphate cytidylyltransferase [Deltaproteobacteria bacterium]